MTDKPLTTAQRNIITSALHHPPSAWVVSKTGHRTGLEREAWKRNCVRLAERGLLRESPFNDWYLTDAGEALLEKLIAERYAHD